jgi:hypothetical protein
LRMFADVVGVGKRQKRVTSWFPMERHTETRAACPVATQMSYMSLTT